MKLFNVSFYFPLQCCHSFFEEKVLSDITLWIAKSKKIDNYDGKLSNYLTLINCCEIIDDFFFFFW